MKETERTPENEARYQEFMKTYKPCFICRRELLVEVYQRWILLNNRFPYDRYYKEHLVLAPIRHTNTLRPEELWEGWEIMQELCKTYDHIKLNCDAQQSIKGHIHWHILKKKDII